MSFVQRNHREADLYNYVYLRVVERISRKLCQIWIAVLKRLYPWGIVLRSSLLVIGMPDVVGIIQPGSNSFGPPCTSAMGKSCVGPMATWALCLRTFLSSDCWGQCWGVNTQEQPSVSKWKSWWVNPLASLPHHDWLILRWILCSLLKGSQWDGAPSSLQWYVSYLCLLIGSPPFPVSIFRSVTVHSGHLQINTCAQILGISLWGNQNKTW